MYNGQFIDIQNQNIYANINFYPNTKTLSNGNSSILYAKYANGYTDFITAMKGILFQGNIEQACSKTT